MTYFFCEDFIENWVETFLVYFRFELYSVRQYVDLHVGIWRSHDVHRGKIKGINYADAEL